MVDRLVNSEANACRIAAVESCFGSSGEPLAVSGRVLVGEGVLTKMCRKKPKPRQFFLFNDILVYGNIVINKKKYNKQHIIPLEEVKLENLADDGALKNGWFIRTPTKSFAVYAATATEKSEWMAHITKCLEDLLKKTGKKQSTEHAAVWVPDGDATTCMHCRKSQFSMINRRHHCRKCGAVVCGPCSNKKFLIPSQSDKPLRVCLACYDTLSKSAATVGSADLSPISLDKPELPDSSGEDDSEEEGDDTNQEKGTNGDGKATDLEVLSTDDKPTFYRNHSEIETCDNSNETEEKSKNTSNNDSNSDATSNNNNVEVSESHSTESSSVIKSDSTSVEHSSSSSVTQSVSHETTSCVSSSCQESNDNTSSGGCDGGSVE
ncbi:pleckstrin homology domain-containing family F member 2-like isoform X2 [Limulus polyphemus]|uniref:Pleckstrin homology domain-containing family F member 2-like isoform X2 n=1 Tax=Limulus polyphemus TaxID=6850 RepID=A0ABM1BKZ9_LIMPO|nr:pleckstrin homology domain-containing family F member 2-like isoform X2 [Limulus polyphemus]